MCCLPMIVKLESILIDNTKMASTFQKPKLVMNTLNKVKQGKKKSPKMVQDMPQNKKAHVL